MALPQMNQDSFSSTELLSGKKIGIKPWRVKEEKDLLFATEGVDDEFAIRREIVKFIKRCVDNVSLFDTLSNTDYVYLIAQIRKMSKGSKLEFSYNCSHCGFPLSDDVSVDKNLQSKKFDASMIKVNGDLNVAIKEVPFQVYDHLTTTYLKSSEFNYHFVIKSIDSIVYKGEVFDAFTETELIEFIDQLSSVDFGAMRDKISAAGAEIYLEKTIKCGKCKKESEVQFGDLYRFLAF
jgi:transcription elongation factor Elf1